MYVSSGVLAACLALLLRLPLVGGAATNTTRTVTTPGSSHSLPESYQFNSRDGWESVIVTNLRYKYRRSHTPGMSSATAPGSNSSSALRRPSSTNTEHSSTKSVFRSVKESLAELTKHIVATSKAEAVTITWFDTFVCQRSCLISGTFRYTGHDLLNPSCWTETNWAPTVLYTSASPDSVAHSQVHVKDKSYVAALTLDGWSEKPKCFKFIERR